MLHRPRLQQHGPLLRDVPTGLRLLLLLVPLLLLLLVPLLLLLLVPAALCCNNSGCRLRLCSMCYVHNVLNGRDA